MLQPGRPSALALLVLGVLALGIRLYRLEARDLWEDEQVTLIDSLGVGAPPSGGGEGQVFEASRPRTPKSAIAIARVSASHDQPIYVTLIHLWTRLIPPTEWTLPLPSAILGALTVPLLAVLGCLFAQGFAQLRPSLARGAGAALCLVLGIFLVKMQLEAPPRMTPRAREIDRLASCVREGQVLRTNDRTEATVVAAWTRSPLLLEVGGEKRPATAWVVQPGTGTVCRASAGSGCDDDFPLCPPRDPERGSPGRAFGVQP